MRYAAFISYNQRDRRWASWLHRELESFRFPNVMQGRESALGPLQRRLPPIFQDREELAASADLAHSVQEALTESASLIVICSRSGAQSHWVNEEVRIFIELGRRDRIQCLIIPEFDDPGLKLSSDQVFPASLLSSGNEPLAADVRSGADTKRAALLKLIAGLAGVRYDELRQREQVRRQRRLIWLATASATGFIIMSALAVFAFIARADAVRERDLARQKTVTAQRTTGFVKGLFEVADPSSSQGEKITALEVLDRGARQITGALENEPNVRAELATTLSEVYLGLGSYRRADNLIRWSMKIPTDEASTQSRRLSVMADSEARQGKYAQAVATFDRAKAAFSAQDRSLDPTLETRIMIGKGEALAALDRFAEADREIIKALRTDTAREGKNGISVARDLEAAGLASNMAGSLGAARKFYQRALTIRLQTQGRTHPRVSEDLNELGTIAYLQNDPKAAEGYWTQTVKLDAEVLGANHPDLANTMNNLARVMIEQREFNAALRLLKRSLAIILAQRDSTHDDLGFIFANVALAEQGIGNIAAAERNFASALRAAETHNSRMIAPILTDLAAIKCRGGDVSTGMALLKRAGPIMKDRYPDDAWRSAWVENTRGLCAAKGGDDARARALMSASAPVILARWPAASLFGAEVMTRRNMLSR